VSWRVAFRLGRVSNLPTVWTNAIAGAVLAGATPAPATVTPLLWLLLSVSLMYVGGMYLNDAFDRDVDARERADRPIPAGLVEARTVFAAGFTFLGAGVVTIVPAALPPGGNPMMALVAAAVLAATIVFYDANHKDNALAPFVMAACRALVYVTAAAATVGRLPWSVVGGAGALFVWVVGLTAVAAQENLRQLTRMWPLALLALPILYGAASTSFSGLAAACHLLLIVWTVHALTFVLRKEGRDVPATVVRLIAGISLLDAVFIAGQGQDVLALIAVGCCALTRILQRYVPGT
jgi:4-hydroxybenzoate polyprenyltransferase